MKEGGGEVLKSKQFRSRLADWRLRSREWRWQLAGKLRQQTTIPTRQGRLTVFTSDQVIGRCLYVHREFESDWVTRALAFLRDTQRLPAKGCGTVLDIGANMGVISIGMLCQGEFARAVGIEPDPRNFHLLMRNVRQNRLADDHYIGLPVGASNQSGSLEFELSPTNFGDHRIRVDSAIAPTAPDRFGESHRNVIRVPVETVDGLLAKTPQQFEDIALVWIDTQGHEGFVFAGGERLFARDIPVCSEFWPYGIHRSGMSQSEFASQAAAFWSFYWVYRNTQFVRYPIAQLSALFEEIGDEGNFDNILFTKQ